MTRASKHPHSKGSGKKLLTESEICDRLQISRITLWRYVRRGTFPTPIYLSPSVKRWTPEQYDTYIAMRSAEAAA